MAKELSVSYEVDGSEMVLTPDVVRSYLTGGDRSIPDSEVVKFMMLCQARKLNPFTGDVYLTSYRTRDGQVKTSVVTGKETFTKRAQRNPRFKGMQAGITVLSADGKHLQRREGSMVIPGEMLIGGWAKVFVDGWSQPSYEEVSYHEYDTGKSMWAAKPATMIRKVAMVHALREAFPDEFQGLYDGSELGDVEDESPVEVEPVPSEETACEEAEGSEAMAAEEEAF